MLIHTSSAMLFLLLISFCLVEIYGITRSKRAHIDNFNVLLNLYKMNPLKNSKVFKFFSNRMLLPNRETNPIKNDESSESVNVKKLTDINVEQMEKMLNNFNKTRKNTQNGNKVKQGGEVLHKNINVPLQFDIDNYDTENFGINAIINESLIGDESVDKDNFNYVFGDIDSKEFEITTNNKMFSSTKYTTITTTTPKNEQTLELVNQNISDDFIEKVHTIKNKFGGHTKKTSMPEKYIDEVRSVPYNKKQYADNAVVIFR